MTRNATVQRTHASQQDSLSDDSAAAYCRREKTGSTTPGNHRFARHQSQPDVAEQSEDTDPAEITINGATDAAEEIPRVSDSVDQVDTTGEDDLAGSSAAASSEGLDNRADSELRYHPDVEILRSSSCPRARARPRLAATQATDSTAPSD